MMKNYLYILLILISADSFSLNMKVPIFYSMEDDNWIVLQDGEKYLLGPVKTPYTRAQLIGQPTGTPTGIAFDFGSLNGTLYYGFIPLEVEKYPQPVFFKSSIPIVKGKAEINIATQLSGKYDRVNWQAKGRGVLGYRVVDNTGTFLYDGKIGFTGSAPFQVNRASIIVGPLVHVDSAGHFHNTARLSFDTVDETKAQVVIKAENGSPSTIISDNIATHHEITLTTLRPSTTYEYTVQSSAGKYTYQESYSFKTAPEPGSRKPFTFAYASDGRQGKGGGERHLEGVNAYIIKKIMALASYKKAAFLQFTGDMINGYSNSVEYTQLQYRNWKRTIEPFAHYMPVLSGFGNHEGVQHLFDNGTTFGLQLDRFPYATDSGEAVFAREMVNPSNGPISEDGTPYDLNPNGIDFPPYQETVFYYTYDNMAMVVLNADYWYSPGLEDGDGLKISGGLHGYLMDNQLDWLEKLLAKLDVDTQLDHVFVTLHTPLFPNGGHIKDTLWYNGNNQHRTIVLDATGKNLISRGIIEQRDKFLEILMKSRKVRLICTGDEHNFHITHLTRQTNIYPEGWDKADIRTNPWFRELWQINNGAAGAPYYSQENTPWTPAVTFFSTQNALALFHISGQSIRLEVLNPDTLAEILQMEF